MIMYVWDKYTPKIANMMTNGSNIDLSFLTTKIKGKQITEEEGAN